MRIAKLIVRKTNPHIEEIRNINFNLKGLNLIVDNTSNSLNETGNNVGKTTVIKIIDLCLGGNSVKELYYDPDTKSENEIIRDFLTSNKVQAELILTDYIYNVNLKRDLFRNGKLFINETPYKLTEFKSKLKDLLFQSSEKSPTFRQLIPKFVRLSNTSADSMIKFLPYSSVQNDIYDSVYSFLFGFLDSTLINKRNGLNCKLSDCLKSIKFLENNDRIESMSVLRQKKEIIDQELKLYNNKRKTLSYMDLYKDELEKKRNITKQINELENKTEFLNFEISTIEDSVEKLSKEKNEINLSVIEKIYKEAHSYIPQLQKTFEDVINFHNQMIQNRIDFINQQLKKKNEKLSKYSRKILSLLEDKKHITVEALDEGLLDELNLLNAKIEELSTSKGRILESINLLGSLEEKKQNLIKEIEEINADIDNKKIDKKLSIFNNYFSQYCEQLYGEKYLLAYNSDWKNSSQRFPVSLSSFGGNVGTGKKKAVIAAFDLAYMKYSQEMKISAPQFVIHDKLENTHINQLKTIFEICENIDGQYIIPILRERINEVDSEYVDKYKILELSSTDKFFKA